MTLLVTGYPGTTATEVVRQLHARGGPQRSSSMDWTFIRAAYFMQNLLTTHGEDLAEGRIAVPAGCGRTFMVDVHDVAEVSALAMLDPSNHRNVAHTVTGPEALSYADCADILTREWGRPITHTSPGVLRYWRSMRQRNLPAPMIAVTIGIYTTARLGLAAATTPAVHDITGHPPRSFEEFARDTRPGPR